MQGKWISLARRFIKDQAPCSTGVYFGCVSAFMPTHIIVRGKRATKMQLSIYALQRFRKENSVIEVDGLLTAAPGKRLFRSFLIEEKVMKGEDVDWKCFHDCDSKTKAALRSYLRFYGYVKCDNEIYRKVEG